MHVIKLFRQKTLFFLEPRTLDLQSADSFIGLLKGTGIYENAHLNPTRFDI